MPEIEAGRELRTFREFYDYAVRYSSAEPVGEPGRFATPWRQDLRFDVYDARLQLGGLLDFNQLGAPPPPIRPSERPTLGQVVADSALRYNGTGSVTASILTGVDTLLSEDRRPTFNVADPATGRLVERPFTVDDWFSEHADILDDAVIAAHVRGEFERETSEAGLLRRIGLLHERLAAEERLMRAGLVKGLVGGVIGAGFLDPINWFSGGIIRNAARVGPGSGLILRSTTRLGDAAINAGIQTTVAAASSQGTIAGEEIAANMALAVAFDFVTLSAVELLRRGSRVSLDSRGAVRLEEPEPAPPAAARQTTPEPETPPSSVTAEPPPAPPTTPRAGDVADAAEAIQAAPERFHRESGFVEVSQGGETHRLRIRQVKFHDLNGVEQNAYVGTIDSVGPDGRPTGSVSTRRVDSSDLENVRGELFMLARREGIPTEGLGGVLSQLNPADAPRSSSLAGAALFDEAASRAEAAEAGAILVNAIPDPDVTPPAPTGADPAVPDVPADNYRKFSLVGDRAGGWGRWLLRGVSGTSRLATTRNGPAAALYHFMFRKPNISRPIEGLISGQALEHRVERLRTDMERGKGVFEKELQTIILGSKGVTVPEPGARGSAAIGRRIFDTAVESLPVMQWPTRARFLFSQAVGVLNVYDDAARGLLELPWHVRRELEGWAEELGMTADALQVSALKVIHALGDPREQAAAVAAGRQSSLAAMRAAQRNSVIVVTMRSTADLDAIAQAMAVIQKLPEDYTFEEALAPLLADNVRATTRETIEADPRRAAEELRAWLNQNTFGHVDKATARRLLEINRAVGGSPEGVPVIRIDYQATVARTTRALIQLETLESLRRMESLLTDPASPVFDPRYPSIAREVDVTPFYEGPDGTLPSLEFNSNLGEDVRAEISDRLDVFIDRANTYDLESRKATTEGRRDAELAVELLRRMTYLDERKPMTAQEAAARTLANITRAKLLPLSAITQMGDVLKAAAEAAFLPHAQSFWATMREGAVRLRTSVRAEGPEALKLLPEAFENMVARSAQMYGAEVDPLREIDANTVGAMAINASRSLSNAVTVTGLMQVPTDFAKTGAATAALGHVNTVAERVLAAMEAGLPAGKSIADVLAETGLKTSDINRLLSRVSPDALADWARAIRAGDVELFNGVPIPKVTRRITTAQVLNDLPATKAGLERLLRNQFEAFIDEGPSDDVAYETGQAMFSTTFHGELPAEVKEAIGGKEGGSNFGLMQYIRIDRNAGGAGARDFIDEFGLDEWLRRLRLLSRSGRMEEIVKMAESSGDGEMHLAAWLWQQLEAGQARSAELAPVPVGRLVDGEGVRIGETDFTVVRQGRGDEAMIRLESDHATFELHNSSVVPLSKADALRLGLDPKSIRSELKAEAKSADLAEESIRDAQKIAGHAPVEAEWSAAIAAAADAFGETGIKRGEFLRLGRWINDRVGDGATDAVVLPFVDDAGRGAIVWHKRVDEGGAILGWEAFEMDGPSGEIIGGEAGVRQYATLRDALVGETGDSGQRSAAFTEDAQSRGHRRLITALGGSAYDDAQLRLFLEGARRHRETISSLNAEKAAWYGSLEGELAKAGFSRRDVRSAVTMIRDLFGDRLTLMRSLEVRAADEAPAGIGGPARGAFAIGADEATGLFRASVTLARDANLQTFLHEVIHYAHVLASDEHWDAIRKTYATGKAWTREAAETLVQDVLRYASDRIRPERWTGEMLMSVARIVRRIGDLVNAGIAWVRRSQGAVPPATEAFADALLSGQGFVERVIRSGEDFERTVPLSPATLQTRLRRGAGMLEEIAADDELVRRATYERHVEDVMAFVSDYINETVFAPLETDRPRFTDNAIGQALWTFWQFPSLVTSRLGLQMPHQSLAHNGAILASMFSAGALSLMLKAWIRQGKDPVEWVEEHARNPVKYLQSLAQASGVLGLAERPIGMVVDAATGQGYTRMRGGLVASLFPAASVLNDYGQAAGDLIAAAAGGKPLTESQARNLYRAAVVTQLAPFQVLGAIGRELNGANETDQQREIASAVRRALQRRN